MKTVMEVIQLFSHGATPASFYRSRTDNETIISLENNTDKITSEDRGVQMLR